MDIKVKKRIFPYINDVSLINNLKIDNESLHYISVRIVSKQITNIIQYHINTNVTITDGTAGVGGNTLSFASVFNKVNAIEIHKTRYDDLVNNIQVYKYGNVKTYNNDFLKIYKDLKQDVIFLDPPWGGADYKLLSSLHLTLSGRLLETICKDLIINKYCKLIVIKIPFNFDLLFFYERLVFVCSKMYIYQLKKMNVLVIM